MKLFSWIVAVLRGQRFQGSVVWLVGICCPGVCAAARNKQGKRQRLLSVQRLFQLTAWWWISLRIYIVSLTLVSHGLPTSWGWWSWWELAVLGNLPALGKGGCPARLALCHCLAVEWVLLQLCGSREGVSSTHSGAQVLHGTRSQELGIFGAGSERGCGWVIELSVSFSTYNADIYLPCRCIGWD